jgi:Holliday junction resolvase
MAAEKNFENRVKKFLKDQGCWFIKYWAGSEFTKSGVPDLLVCCNGHFLGIELKGPKGRPSELQLWNIEQIKKAGGIAMVLYPKDFDEFKTLIHKLVAK